MSIEGNVAIVYPSYQAFKSKTKSLEWDVRWIQHGIASIIAYAKKEGIDVDLIDLRRLNDWDDFSSRIANYDIVAFSALTTDYPNTMKSIKITKEQNPKTKVVVGGVHPSIALEDFVNCKDIDFIVQGEGEIVFAELVKSILSKKKCNRIVRGTPVINLDEIPFIDRTLWERESPIGLKYKEPFVTILASRACVYGCKFCQPTARIIFGGRERCRSVENVIAELIQLREQYHFNFFLVHDDNFLQNKEWCEKFVKQYKENSFDAEFMIQARADLICRHEDLVKKLAGIGLSYTFVGFESGSQRILNYIAKGTTVEQNIKSAKILKKYDVKIFANIMFGVPTETREEAVQTEKMVDKIQPDHLSITYYTPYPGSFIADECKKNNLILVKEYDRMVRYPNEPKIKGIDYEFLDKIKQRMNVKHALYNHNYLNFFWGLSRYFWQTISL